MAKKTADDWAMAALKALAEGGAPAVRVEVLARRLKVTKGSFYHHFKNRRQVLDHAVATWEELATSQVIEVVNSSAGTATERLVALARTVFPEHELNDAIEAALREWSVTDEAVAEALARVDERRLSYVEALLREAGVGRPRERSELLYRALVGEFAYRRAGGPALSEDAVMLLTGLLLSEPAPLPG